MVDNPIPIIASIAIDFYLALLPISVIIGILRYFFRSKSEHFQDFSSAQKQGWLWGLNCALFSIPISIGLAAVLFLKFGIK